MKNLVQFGFRALLASMLAVLFFGVTTVHGQGVNDFVITNFTATYRLDNTDPQGKLEIQESIEVDFSGNNHGILRAIPKTYNDFSVNVKVQTVQRDGIEEPYTTYDQNDNLVLQIGRADETITGAHSYVIAYSVENVIRFYEDHDELFWDVNGDQWLQPFEAVRAIVISDAPVHEKGVRCFTGTTNLSSEDCEISATDDAMIIQTARQLGSAETLSYVQAFEKGYFTPMSWWERHQKKFLLIPIAALQIYAVVSAHKQWRRFGKDPKKRGVVAPYFERPKNVSVMQAGYVAENKLTSKMVSASIIDLAIRGYIKIIERKNGRHTKHDLVKQEDSDERLTSDEKLLLEKLFAGKAVGESIELEAKKNKLYTMIEELKVDIDKTTLEKGFYEISPKNAAKKFVRQWVLGVLAVVIGIVFAEFSEGLTVVSGILAGGIIVVYAALMTKRTQAGNLMIEHIEGLKLYLTKAEKERIKMQDAVAAPLAPHSGEPLRDVQFFENLLPFAVAAGVEKSWAKAFEDIYAQPPEWYGGNWNTFSTVHLANSLASTTAVAGSAFSAPSSSSGSGFSGGSAGGGGGGGGGGGW